MTDTFFLLGNDHIRVSPVLPVIGQLHQLSHGRLTWVGHYCLRFESYKYSQREEYVEQYKPQMELRTRPKVKIKLCNTKKERVLRSPYYLANKLCDQLDHEVQNLDTMFEFATATTKI